MRPEWASSIPRAEPIEIYHPNIPKNLDKTHFQNMIERINFLKDQGKSIIGFSYIQNKKTHNWTPVVITHEPSKRTQATTFRVFSFVNGSFFKNGNFFELGFNDAEPSELHHISSGYNKEYKYVGYILFKAMQQVFKNNVSNQPLRLFRMSTAPIEFYYKLGFVCCEEWEFMKLPEKAKSEWLKEVTLHPIEYPEDFVTPPDNMKKNIFKMHAITAAILCAKLMLPPSRL